MPKRGGFIAVSMAALTAFLFFVLGNTALQDQLLIAAAGKQLRSQGQAFSSSDDHLYAFVCGSSSPIAAPGRAKACIGVFADDKLFLFDVGAGSWSNIELWRLPTHKLTAVFLTHYHSDHITDLGEANIQSWLWGRAEALKVYGPTGIERVTEGFNDSYAIDYEIRHRQAGEDLLPIGAAEMEPFALDVGEDEIVPVYSDGKLTISAFLVDHKPVEPAIAYKVQYGDRIVVISGDTRPLASMVTHASEADILFHEAVSLRFMRIFAEAVEQTDDERMKQFAPRFGEAHTYAHDAVDIAQAANVKKLVLYHLLPPPRNSFSTAVFRHGLPQDVIVSNDGMLFSLPLNSDRIKRKNL